MAEAVINYSDLVYDDGAFLKLEKDFETHGKKLEVIANNIKNNLRIVDVKDSSKIAELEAEIKKLNSAYRTLETSIDKVKKQRKTGEEINKKARIELEKERISIRQRNLEARNIAIVNASQSGSIEQLRAKLALVTIAWSKLSNEEKENSSRGQRVIESKRQLTEQLKAEEKATGDNRRNVGNYTESIRQAVIEINNERNALELLLVDLKKEQSQLDKNTIEYRLYEKEIQKTQGQLRKLDVVYDESKRKGVDYQKTVSKTRNILAQLGLAYGVFEGIRTFSNNEIQLQRVQLALKNVLGTTQKYNKAFGFLTTLSKKYGQDLLVLTDTYKGFIASSESSNLSIEERNKIYESIIKSGSSLALSNDQIQGSLLAVSQMFSKGTVQAEELRGQLGERLPGAFGIMAKAIGVTEMELGKMLKDGKVMAKEVLPKFAVELEKTFGANAEQNIKTIGGAWNILKTNIMEYFNEANNSNKITEKIANTFRFVSNNLGTIISVLSKAITGWITYKTIMRVLATNDLIKLNGGLGTTIKNMVGIGKATNEATEQNKKFGQSLRAIGWTVIIGFAIELGRAYWNMVDGTSQLDENLKRLEKQQQKSTKVAQERIANRQKALDKLNQQESKALENAKSENEKNEIVKKFTDLKKEQIKINKQSNIQDIKSADARKLAYKKEYLGVKEISNEFKNGRITAEEYNNKLEAISKNLVNFKDFTFLQGFDPLAGIVDEKDLLAQLKANIEGTNTRLIEYYAELNNVTSTNSTTTKENTKERSKNTTELKANADELQRIIDLLDREAQARYELFSIQNEFNQEQIQNQIDKEIELRSKEAENFGVADTKKLSELLAQQLELKKEAVKEEYNFKLNELLNSQNNENLIKFQDLEKERDELLKQENLTVSEKNKINQSYKKLLEEINYEIVEDNKVLNIERESLEVDLKNKLTTLDQQNVESKENANTQILENQRKFITDWNNIGNVQRDEEIEEIENSMKHQRKIIDKNKNENNKAELNSLKNLIKQKKDLQEIEIVDRWDNEIEQTEKGSAKEIELKEKKNNELLGLERKYQDDIANIDDEIAKHKIDTWNNVFKGISDILGKILDRIEENQQKQLEETQKQLEKQNDAVEEQRRRAELGLTNTLAFEKKEQAKRESEQIKAQKKLERTQKIKSLYAAYSGYASSGDSANAITKTLRDFAILEGIAATFGGGGIVEDELPKNGIFKGASHKSKSGGIPIMVEGEEGIFSKKEMRNLGKDNFYSIKNLAGSGKISDIFADSQKSFVAVVPQKNEDISIIKEEMQMLRKSFDNIEWQKIDAPGFIDGVYKIKEHLKSKGKTTINNYIIEKPKF